MLVWDYIDCMSKLTLGPPLQDMWQAARERSAQRKAAKAAAAAAASAVTQDSADEEETAKSFECLSMDKPEQPAIDCGEETGTQQAAQKAKCGCLSRKVGCG